MTEEIEKDGRKCVWIVSFMNYSYFTKSALALQTCMFVCERESERDRQRK